MPLVKQTWPKVAACWSPREPAIGTPARKPALRPRPYSSELDRISGSIDIGMPISPAMPASQASVR